MPSDRLSGQRPAAGQRHGVELPGSIRSTQQPIRTGIAEAPKVPSPSRPRLLSPQVQSIGVRAVFVPHAPTVPAESTATERLNPAPMEMASSMPGSSTGTSASRGSPVPSTPPANEPQAPTWPSLPRGRRAPLAALRDGVARHRHGGVGRRRQRRERGQYRAERTPQETGGVGHRTSDMVAYSLPRPPRPGTDHRSSCRA